jgi:CTP synthase
VQVIPHITDEIKRAIARLPRQEPDLDVVITEIGGTVGDIESLPFLEAIRQFRLEAGPRNTCVVHVTLVPYIKAAEELKTKPTQHSVRELRAIGIQPDILLARCEYPLTDELRRKIALFCNVSVEAVIPARDVPSIYQVPLALHEYGLDGLIVERLDLVEIAICGKYVDLRDSYKSIEEALVHGGIENDVEVRIRWVNAEDVTPENVTAKLGGVDGVLVPPGFGERGIEGMVTAIEWTRRTETPFFGICLGMQCATIEYARHVCGLRGATSTEFDPDAEHPVIALMADQIDIREKGGTMRLGAWPCVLQQGSLARQIYGEAEISERHRHRYEVNNAYRDALSGHGLVLSGTSPDGRLVEMIELADHPWFVGCQFHPDVKSRPLRPHPLFRDFVRAAAEHGERRSDTDVLEAQAAQQEVGT